MSRVRPSLRPLPQFFEGKGWQSWEELCHYVFWSNYNHRIFDEWRSNDGTRDGFFRDVGLRQGAPPYKPGETVMPYGG